MELSINDYITFLSLDNDPAGLWVVSALLVLMAAVAPFMAMALLCIYPELPWAASWKIFVTVYPMYPLLLVLCLRCHRRFPQALFQGRYGVAVAGSLVLVLWSFMSPLLYSPSSGPPFTFAHNPNFQRGLQTLSVLLLLPMAVTTREDFDRFIRAATYLLIAVHLLVFSAGALFLASGHSVYDLHLMKVLNTPPIYWESGLLLIFLSYHLAQRKLPPHLMAFIPVACAGLILGNSRTRFVATCICVLYLLYPFVSRRILSLVGVCLFTAAIGTLLLPGKAKTYFERLVDQRIEQSSRKNLDDVATGRMTGYRIAFQRWEESPVVGVGSCYILPRPVRLVPLAQAGDPPLQRVHNYFLEILAGQGMVGLNLLLLVLGISLVQVAGIARRGAKEVNDGRVIIALFWFGIINWFFKESWGITYAAVALLSIYSSVLEETREEAPCASSIS